MTAHTIRPFLDDDQLAIMEINNRDRPPHRKGSAAAWAWRDTLRKPEHEAQKG